MVNDFEQGQGSQWAVMPVMMMMMMLFPIEKCPKQGNAL
jgi:hypothetical protein